MKLWNKDLLYEVPGEPSGAAASSPPVEPPSNPTDPNPDAVSESDNWVLDHFSSHQAEDASEDISMVVEPTPSIPAQAGMPEGEIPSEPQGQARTEPAALATPAPVTAAPTVPVPQVGAAVQTPVVSTPAVPVAPPPDPTQIMAQIAEGIQRERTAFIQKLATEQYALSEKQLDDLGLTPEQGKLWSMQQATVHVNTAQSQSQLLAQQLPVIVNGLLEARNVNQRREDEFFSSWPQLKDAPREKLAQVFQAVNQLHPDLKGQAWSKKAGEMACISLGKPIQTQQPHAANGHAPQQVRTPGPIVRQVQGSPHLPMAPNTLTAPLQPQLSEWERFSQLMAATEAGEFDQ